MKVLFLGKKNDLITDFCVEFTRQKFDECKIILADRTDINTEALLTFVDGKILSVDLNLKAKVSGISKDKFDELAEEAKNDCPISGALNCEVNLKSIIID